MTIIVWNIFILIQKNAAEMQTELLGEDLGVRNIIVKINEYRKKWQYNRRS